MCQELKWKNPPTGKKFPEKILMRAENFHAAIVFGN